MLKRKGYKLSTNMQSGLEPVANHNGNKERETTDMSVQPQLQATPDLADLDAWVEFHAAVQDWAGAANDLPLVSEGRRQPVHLIGSAM